MAYNRAFLFEECQEASCSLETWRTDISGVISAPVSHGPSRREAKEVEGAVNESGWHSSPTPGHPSLLPPPASVLQIRPLVCLLGPAPSAAVPALPPAGTGASLTAQSVLIFFTSTASAKWVLLPRILPDVWQP